MKADGKHILLMRGFNKDVVGCMIDVFNQCKSQCLELVAPLRDMSYSSQIRSIWDYFVSNVAYVEDPGFNQYLKTPARLLSDGIGDCKSFSLFFGSCLYCLNIPFVFRFVSFNSSPDFQHVYVVACPYTSQQIILDAVEKDADGEPRYNYARNFIYNKDIAA
ncbi:MAG: hypothetical protein IKL29_05365 [Bacteroidaceae bacterium]|nr:hypothetical protein [Bacteroidaceae bacterium]